MSTFFISDTHFNHTAIMKYCHRPWVKPEDLNTEGDFVSPEVAAIRTEEMDEAMISNWNRVVGPKDSVWHLGDFAFCRGRKKTVEDYLDRLNGHINLIYGNHDDNKTKRASEFVWGGYYKKLRFGEHSIILCHYAFDDNDGWDLSHYGSIHLHGHWHNNFREDQTKRRMNVAVDCIGLTPIALESVLEVVLARPFVPIGER
jgi:calcineurin-like phosphoesterase family protein